MRSPRPPIGSSSLDPSRDGGLVLIRAYIGQDSPLAGIRMARRLKGAGESLGLFPDRGRRAGGHIRKWTVIYPYIIRYTVSPGAVRIIRIKHGAQRPE